MRSATSTRSLNPSDARLGPDFALMLIVLALIGTGLLTLFSVSDGRSDGKYLRQALNVAVGIVPFAIFAFANPIAWRKFASTLYGINLMMLVAVIVAGTTVNGAKRWIEIGPLQFQPSEMAKLSLVLTLSAFYANRPGEVRRFSTFALSFLHVAVPMALVFKQPHLGASLVLVVVWLSVSLYAGVPRRFVLGSVLAGAVLLAGAYFAPGVLKDYQKQRVRALFVYDAAGHSYQTDRAEIAFGVGGVTGTGFLKGQQKKNGFIPEQDTDFIFTVIGEEGGFLGCVIVLALFGALFYRIWLVGYVTREPYYKMVVGGILAMIGFHTLVNLAMNLQLGPVVGLWLPFLSYGGTAMWLCLACIGLLLAIRFREKPILF